MCMILIWLATLVFAFIHSPYFWTPRNDAQVYVLVGKVLAEGGTLYQDIFDHKGPAFLSMDAFGWLLTKSDWGVWAIESVFLGLVLCVFYRGLRNFLGRGASLVLAIGVLTLSFELNHPDTLVMELVFLSAGILAWGRLSPKSLFLVGLCAGAAFMSKVASIGAFVALGLFLCLRLRAEPKLAARQLAAFVGGGVTMVLFWVVVMCCRCELAGFVRANYDFNVAYGKLVGGRAIFKGFLTLKWCGTYLVLASLGLYGLMRFRSRQLPLLLPYGFWVLWELALLAKGMGPYPYQYAVLLAATYLPLILLLRAAQEDGRRQLPLLLALSAALVVAWASYKQAYHTGNAWDLILKAQSLARGARQYNGSADPIPAVEAKLQELGAKSLFAKTHQCRLYYDTGITNPLAPFYYYGPMATPGYLTDAEVDELMAKLERAPGLVIVDETHEPDLTLAPPGSQDRSFSRRFHAFVHERMRAVESGNYRFYVLKAEAK